MACSSLRWCEDGSRGLRAALRWQWQCEVFVRDEGAIHEAGLGVLDVAAGSRKLYTLDEMPEEAVRRLVAGETTRRVARSRLRKGECVRMNASCCYSGSLGRWLTRMNGRDVRVCV